MGSWGSSRTASGQRGAAPAGGWGYHAGIGVLIELADIFDLGVPVLAVKTAEGRIRVQRGFLDRADVTDHA